MTLAPIVSPTPVPCHFPREDFKFKGCLALPNAFEPRPKGPAFKESHVCRIRRETLIGRPNPLEGVIHHRLQLDGRQGGPQGKVLDNGRDREARTEVSNPPTISETLLHSTSVKDLLIHEAEQQRCQGLDILVVGR